MNQKGFGIISILFLLPVLVLTGLLSFWGYDIVQKYSHAQDLCRDRLLLAQKEMGRSLVELLSLNPAADKLREQEKWLRLKIIASSANPTAAARYGALLTKNLWEQGLLRTQQESILKVGEWRARQILGSLRRTLSIKNNITPKIHVKKSPPLSIAGHFEPQTFFSQRQNLQAFWTQKTTSAFFQYLPGLPRKIEGQCAATLKQERNLWNAHITDLKFSQVRSLWK